MTYDEFIAAKATMKKAHDIRLEVAELTETLKVIQEGDLVTTIKTGGREYVLPAYAERVFIDSLKARVEKLNEEFASL